MKITERKKELFKKLIEGDYYLVKAYYKGPHWILSKLQVATFNHHYKQTIFNPTNVYSTYTGYIVLLQTEMFTKKGQVRFLKNQNLLKLLYDET